MGNVSGEKILQGQGRQPDLVSDTPARGGGLELDDLFGGLPTPTALIP